MLLVENKTESAKKTFLADLYVIRQLLKNHPETDWRAIIKSNGGKMSLLVAVAVTEQPATLLDSQPNSS